MKYIWQRENWSDFSWESDKLLPLLSKARRVQGEILARGRALGINLTHQAQEEILIEEAIKTSRLKAKFLTEIQ